MLYRGGGLGQASKDTSTTPPTAHLLNKHIHSTAADFISYYRDSPDTCMYKPGFHLGGGNLVSHFFPKCNGYRTENQHKEYTA